ncbi:MAG TPA: HAMP domain-containing sensor histidine kinase [Acidimicrobiales bacterium]|jgi:signal transduction histidine kinase
MRRRLALSAAAVTAMVVIAFVVPLAFVVKLLSNERATDGARLEAQSLADVLGVFTDRTKVAQLVDEANGRGRRTVTIYLSNGDIVGPPVPGGASLQRARQGASFTTSAAGGEAVLVPVRSPDGGISVVRVAVPAAVLNRGVTRTWALLAALGVALVALSVVLADRLARSLVRPMGQLAVVAEQLETGDLSARVAPAGPAEVAHVGQAVNQLAERIGELVATEREAAADLSHRLRTPLTALRLDADGLDDPLERDRVGAAVDALETAISQVIAEARQPRRPVGARSCDLVATTRARAAFWAALAEVQTRPCSLDLPPDTIEVGASRTDLAAALDALVANVFAHTPEGTAFEISVARAGDGGVLVVADEGPGFPPGLRPTRGKSTVGSTGLGLDIARAVAESCGGRMRTTASSRGGGRVELVLRRAPVEPLPPATGVVSRQGR